MFAESCIRMPASPCRLGASRGGRRSNAGLSLKKLQHTYLSGEAVWGLVPRYFSVPGYPQPFCLCRLPATVPYLGTPGSCSRRMLLLTVCA